MRAKSLEPIFLNKDLSSAIPAIAPPYPFSRYSSRSRFRCCKSACLVPVSVRRRGGQLHDDSKQTDGSSKAFVWILRQDHSSCFARPLDDPGSLHDKRVAPDAGQ